MIKRLVWILAVLLISSQAAQAIDTGTLSGTLRIGDEVVELREVYAHFHDNAEGLLDRPKEMRIVLSDRPIPQESLRGIAFLPVTRLAREGKVAGLLLQFDPKDQHRMVVTLLRKPSQPGKSLMTLSLIDTEQNLFKKLKISETRVEGEIDYAETHKADSEGLPSLSYSAIFSAPRFHEMPVTSDLKGKAAQSSPQVKILREKAKALGKGDFAAVSKLTSEAENRRNETIMEQMGDQIAAISKEAAVDLEKSLKTIQRVVVRGDRAVVIFANKGWANFVKEGGQWKSDD
jgi:hypothetical protein